MESGNYEDVGESQEIFLNLSPVGTILPWVPKPIKDDSVTTLAVPEGWAKCDGSIIQAPSIWAGQRTPDLNNEMRFLRGLKVEGIADAYRKGDETRPRNMHVAYIMRIF